MTAALDDVRYLVGEWIGRATSGDPPLEVRTSFRPLHDHFLERDVESRSDGGAVQRERHVLSEKDGVLQVTAFLARGEVQQWAARETTEPDTVDFEPSPPDAMGDRFLEWKLRRTGDDTFCEVFRMERPTGDAAGPFEVEIEFRRAGNAVQ